MCKFSQVTHLNCGQVNKLTMSQDRGGKADGIQPTAFPSIQPGESYSEPYKNPA